jgi:inosine/xanthosine triphosphatase
MSLMYFFVGSTNPVKITAVQLAIQEKFPDAVVKGCEVESGVSAQPMSDEETKLGAENRARKALEKGQREVANGVMTLGIGLEGGVFENSDGMWSTVWAVVVDPEDKFYYSNGARIKIDEVIATKIRLGQELGPLIQELTGITDVRQKEGMFGVVTQRFVNRTEEYASLAKMAIGTWYGRNWKNDLSKE